MLTLIFSLILTLILTGATSSPSCVQCAGDCYFDTCGPPSCLPNSYCMNKCNPVVTTTNVCMHGCEQNSVTHNCESVTKTPIYIHTLQQAADYCSSSSNLYSYADTSNAANGNAAQWDSPTSFLCPHGCSVLDPTQTKYNKNNLCSVDAYYANAMQYSYTPICRECSPPTPACEAQQCMMFNSPLSTYISCDNVMLVCPIGYVFERTFPQCGSNVTDICKYNDGILFSRIECLNKINGIKCNYYRDVDCSRTTIVESCPNSCGCTMDPLRSRCVSSDNTKICGTTGVMCPINYTVSVEGGCYGSCETPTCKSGYILKYVDGNGQSGYPLCFPSWYYG